MKNIVEVHDEVLRCLRAAAQAEQAVSHLWKPRYDQKETATAVSVHFYEGIIFKPAQYAAACAVPDTWASGKPVQFYILAGGMFLCPVFVEPARKSRCA